MTLFKKCVDCDIKMAQSDGCTLYLFCLEKVHNTTACEHCHQFTLKARLERASQLEVVLWEKSLGAQRKKCDSPRKAGPSVFANWHQGMPSQAGLSDLTTRKVKKM